MSYIGNTSVEKKNDVIEIHDGLIGSTVQINIKDLPRLIEILTTINQIHND